MVSVNFQCNQISKDKIQICDSITSFLKVYCLRARQCVGKSPSEKLDCEDDKPGGEFGDTLGDKCQPGRVKFLHTKLKEIILK